MASGQDLERGGQGQRGLRGRRVVFAVAVACLLALGGWLVWQFEVDPYLQDGCLPGCAGFAMGGAPVTTVSPGSAGCRDLAGNLCYLAWFTTPAPGKAFSDLRLYVVNESYAAGPPIPLGPNATVTALGSSDQTVAIWNVAQQEWSLGGGIGIPRNAEVTVVLDTRLTSNQTLIGTMLEGVLSGSGSGGVPLLPFGA